MSLILAGTAGVTFPDSTTQATAAASAMTLISTQTASNSASLSFTGLSTYNSYMLVFKNIVMASAGQVIYLTIGTGSTPTYITSGYYDNGVVYYSTSSSATVSYLNQSNFTFCAYGINSSGAGASGTVFLNGFLSNYLTYNALAEGVGSSFAFSYYQNGYVNSSNTTTAIKLVSSSGNITSGSVSLYGISS